MGSDQIHVARQPIFDRMRRVTGYELLFRRSQENFAQVFDARSATNHVISASYLDIGINELTAGRPAFINFSRDLLLDGTVQLLQPEQVVVEILETVPPDEDVVNAVRDLKRRGYRFALDDFSGSGYYDELMPWIDILKVDLVSLPSDGLDDLVKRLRARHSGDLILLAEKVENHRQLADAKNQGFQLFQGFFFATPEVLQTSRIPETKMSHLKLLQTFNSPFLDFGAMEDIVKSDIALTTKLLKYINAAAFPWAGRVKSVKHALVLLGERNIRKWASLVALTGMAKEKPIELAIASSCRGRFCELAGGIADESHTDLDHFLLGALSTLDAMLDAPMELALRQIPISEEVKSALCGETGALHDLLQVTTSYERGEWSMLDGLCRRVNLHESSLPQIYRQALVWSDRVLRN